MRDFNFDVSEDDRVDVMKKSEFLNAGDRIRELPAERRDRIVCAAQVMAEAHEAWFRGKVLRALNDEGSTLSHQVVMDEAQSLIDRKRNRN